jgi:hypothetical protein
MKFKCKVSGTVVEFTQPVDIETTIQNPAYVIVDETFEPVEGALVDFKLGKEQGLTSNKYKVKGN